MEQHLISLTILDRVPADPNDIVRLRVQLRSGTAHVMLLGRKGSTHIVQNENTYTYEQLLAAAKEGLLYVQKRIEWAFAPELDAGTGLPVLMESYTEAFRKRQLDNSAPVASQQQMKLKPAEEAK